MSANETQKPYTGFDVDSMGQLAFEHPSGGRVKSKMNYKFPKDSTWMEIGYIQNPSRPLKELPLEDLSLWWYECLEHLVSSNVYPIKIWDKAEKDMTLLQIKKLRRGLLMRSNGNDG